MISVNKDYYIVSVVERALIKMDYTVQANQKVQKRCVPVPIF